MRLLIILIIMIYSIQVQSRPIETNHQRFIIINEEHDVIINGIRDFKVSFADSLFFLINATGLNIYQYNLFNGKLLNYFESTDTLNSSLLSKPEYWSTNYYYSSKDYLLVINSLAKDIGRDISEIRNNFKKLFVYNDSLLAVSCTFRAFAIDTLEGKTLLMNIGGLIVFDRSLNLIYATPVEANSYEYSMELLLIPYNEDTFIYFVSNGATNNIDSMTFCSEFALNGKNIGLLSVLPYEYHQYNMGYSAIGDLSMIKINDQVFWTSSLDYKIRCFDSTKTFELQGYKTTNLETWKKVSHFKTLKIIPEERERANLEMNNLRLSSWIDSLMIIASQNQDMNVQIYSTKGELIEHYILIPPNNQIFVHIDFVKENNKIYAVTRDDDYYYLVEYILK